MLNDYKKVILAKKYVLRVKRFMYSYHRVYQDFHENNCTAAMEVGSDLQQQRKRPADHKARNH